MRVLCENWEDGKQDFSFRSSAQGSALLERAKWVSIDWVHVTIHDPHVLADTQLAKDSTPLVSYVLSQGCAIILNGCPHDFLVDDDVHLHLDDFAFGSLSPEFLHGRVD